MRCVHFLKQRRCRSSETDSSIEAIETAMEPEAAATDDGDSTRNLKRHKPSGSSTSTATDEETAATDDGDSTRSLKRHKPSGSTSTTADGETLDRISDLPDALLIHILSFLPTKHAIKTSILARRWQCLWTFIPNPILDFYDPTISHVYQNNENMQRFVSFVNRTLIRIESPKVKKFRFQFGYREAIAPDIDVWLRFAMRRNVEELDLSFTKQRPIRDSTDEGEGEGEDENEGEDEDEDYCIYHLPRNVLRNSSLVTLKLVHCMIEQCGIINWKSLKVLSLSLISNGNDLIPEILLGCPLIESLELCYCLDYDVLDIKSETLRKLVVNNYFSPRSTLKISAPNLQSLEILGFMHTKGISFINLSSLVEAKLTFHLTCGPSDYKECAMILRDMVEKLLHVKDLTLGIWFLQILSVLEKKDFSSSFSNRMSLTIETQLTKWELPGITTMLALTPLLDTLVIIKKRSRVQLSNLIQFKSVSMKSFDFDQENYWLSQKSFFVSALHNLKTIKIVNFMGLNEEIELISFLLESTKQLEKMIIYRKCGVFMEKSNGVAKEKLQEVVQRLLNLPRCSHDAVVLIF